MRITQLTIPNLLANSEIDAKREKWRMKYYRNKTNSLASRKKWVEKNRDRHNANQRAYNKRSKEKDPENERKRKKHWALTKMYGLSLESYNNMKEKQGGLCAICKRKRLLVVDHDHKSNRVRGLLCHGCNLFLGRYETNRHLLDAAEKYIRRYDRHDRDN